MANVFDLNAPPSKEESKFNGVRSKKRVQKLTQSELVSRQARLVDLVDASFMAIEDALHNADHTNSIKAAQIVLDRAGFGPKSTVDVNSTHVDLSRMSTDQLRERLDAIRMKLNTSSRESAILDVEPVAKEETKSAALIPFTARNDEQHPR